jgi:hypothetical protein
MSEEVPLPVSTRAMGMLVQKVGEIEDNRIREDLALYALTQMQSRVASFGKQVRFTPIGISSICKPSQKLSGTMIRLLRSNLSHVYLGWAG